MPAKYTPEQRITAFWKKVDKSAGDDGCWLWTAHNVNSYGLFKWDRKVQLAHRISYRLKYGDFPQELDILHSCDNPSCVNPKHLFIGTHQDNMRDMMAKHRGNKASGERSRHKLSDEDIRLIRNKHDTGLFSRSQLSVEFNTSKGHIAKIVRGAIR